MKLIDYINNISPNKPSMVVSSVTQLTDRQFREYSIEKSRYENSLTPKAPKEKKVKKPRADKGKPRAKYDPTLPKKYISYLKRANSKSIPMELSVERFEELCSGTCVYCKEQATGIDRVDASKGYVEGNIQSCCYKCNMMKHVFSHEEFIQRVILIADNHR